jgi:serine/threonine-protein kinase
MATPKRPDSDAAITKLRSDPDATRLTAPLPLPRAPEVHIEPTPLSEPAGGQRYEVAELLGEGGMGEVYLCRDRRIGRDVAMKVMRPEHGASSGARARFEREARVQGQLEHPSVVPVYDLGIGPEGVYFTMKRVRGLTLEQVIDGLRVGDNLVAGAYSTHRLLTAFGSVCLAVAFAHARGVLHRDLKPGNIMLGDFGEIHVLDWGLARISGTAEAAVGIEPIRAEVAGYPRTAVGEILGTLGYMAPEQLRGDVAAQGPATDVYALGAILFELLTLEPLHARPSADALMASTLAGADARPSVRAPHRDVPPELESICVRATAQNPADRFGSALELQAAIERYLEGDRDLVRRRALAAEHAAAAEQAAALAGRGGEEGKRARERALQEASSALALAPDHAGALQTLVRLLLDPPAEIPGEARAEFQASGQGVARAVRQITFFAYLLWFAGMVLTQPLGIRDFRYHVVSLTVMLIVVAVSYASMRLEFGSRGRLCVHVLGALALAAMFSWMGPFILVPSLAAIHALGYVVYGDPRFHRYGIAADVLAVCAPAALQAIGWLPPSYVFHDGGMTVVPRSTDLPPVLTPAALFVISVGLVVGPALVFRRVRAKMIEMEERLFLQGWNLRHLVPDAARAATAVQGQRAR